MLADLKKVNPSRYVIYVGFLAILAFFSIALRDAGFATPGNLVHIVQKTAPVTVIAVGTVFWLTSGEIDLSIGSGPANPTLLKPRFPREYTLHMALYPGLY